MIQIIEENTCIDIFYWNKKHMKKVGNILKKIITSFRAHFLRNIIFSWAILWILFGVYIKYFSSPKVSDGEYVQSSNIIEAVKQDILSQLSLVGKSKIQNEQNLNFNVLGQVTEVNVNAGQEIKAGTVLARVKSDSVLNNIRRQQIELDNARKKLSELKESQKVEAKKLRTQITDKQREIQKKKEDMQMSERTHKIEKNNLENSFKGLKLDVEKKMKTLALESNTIEHAPTQKELELKIAKENYSLAEAEYNRDFALLESSLQKVVNDYDIGLKSEVIATENNLQSMDSSLESFNELLGVESDVTLRNPALEEYFSAKDSQKKFQAKASYRDAKESIRIMREQIKSLPTDINPSHVKTLLIERQKMNEAILLLADSIIKGVDASIYSVGSVEKWSYESYKTSALALVSQMRNEKLELRKKIDEISILANPKTESERKASGLRQKKYELQKQKLALETLEGEVWSSQNTVEIEKQKLLLDLEQLKNQIKLKEIDFQKFLSNYEYEKKSGESSITQMELDLGDTRKNLKDLESSDNESIRMAHSAIEQAEISVDDARKNLEKYELRAPFDWIVSRVSLSVGDNLTEKDTDKVISLQNPNIVEITANIDQVDVVKVKRGQSVQVKFGAYPQESFSWSVMDVGLAANADTSNAQYQVKVVVDVSSFSKKIYSGMNVELWIILNKISNALVISAIAIEQDTQSWKSFVNVIRSGGKVEKQVIEIGYNDGTQAEVLSWLQEGDKIQEVNYQLNSLPEKSYGPSEESSEPLL